jgi:hypothetical protein
MASPATAVAVGVPEPVVARPVPVGVATLLLVVAGAVLFTVMLGRTGDALVPPTEFDAVPQDASIRPATATTADRASLRCADFVC